MALPKREVAVWLPATVHEKLKALAAAKNVSMGQYAAHWVEQAVEAKYMEAVCVYRAVVAAGMHTEEPATTRKGPDDFQPSSFDPRSQA
jgi:hypothetical protein